MKQKLKKLIPRIKHFGQTAQNLLYLVERAMEVYTFNPLKSRIVHQQIQRILPSLYSDPVAFEFVHVSMFSIRSFQADSADAFDDDILRDLVWWGVWFSVIVDRSKWLSDVIERAVND